MLRLWWISLIVLLIAHFATQSAFIEETNLATLIYKMAIETTDSLTSATSTSQTSAATTSSTSTSAPSTSTSTATTSPSTDEKQSSYPAIPLGPIDPLIPLRALVLGATGQTGRHVVRHLAQSSDVTSVTAIVRKEVKMDMFDIKDDAARAKVTQQVVDFEKLDDYASAFTGPNAVFNCLGSTRAKAGSAAAFRHIDYDYSLHSAHLLRRLNSHPIHYSLLTSQGANAKSSLLYIQVKGQIEEDIKPLGFARYSIFRPGMLLTSREESRKAEFVFQKIVSGLDFMLPQKWKGTTTSRVAESMVVNALRPGTTFEVYESAQLRQLHVGREPFPTTSSAATHTSASTTPVTESTTAPSATNTTTSTIDTEPVSPPR